MIKLIKPLKKYFNQLKELKQDFINNNESHIQCCVLWVFSYQLNKIYLCLVKGEINSYKNE